VLRALWLVLPCLLIALAGPVAQADDRQYDLKQVEPRTGSLFRRYEVQGSKVPINKRYDEFTEEEKKLIKELYEHIGPGDEPPFPADGLKPIFDAVRQAQNKLLVKGQLILLVTVAPSG
jgi:hypothetical protein